MNDATFLLDQVTGAPLISNKDGLHWSLIIAKLFSIELPVKCPSLYLSEENYSYAHPRKRFKRTKSKGLFDILDKTKANEVAAVVGADPAPERSAQELRSGAPGTAAHHAQVAITTGCLFPR